MAMAMVMVVVVLLPSSAACGVSFGRVESRGAPRGGERCEQRQQPYLFLSPTSMHPATAAAESAAKNESLYDSHAASGIAAHTRYSIRYYARHYVTAAHLQSCLMLRLPRQRRICTQGYYDRCAYSAA